LPQFSALGIDQVPVVIAEEHGATSSRLIGGLHHKLASDPLEAEALAIDIMNFEFKNDRAVCRGDRGAGVKEIRCPLAADGESSGGGFQLNIVFDSYGAEAGDRRVKPRQGGDDSKRGRRSSMRRRTRRRSWRQFGSLFCTMQATSPNL
jgi:hypothetical protein